MPKMKEREIDPTYGDCRQAAGFFDGEGCIEFARNMSPRGVWTYKVRTSISQKYPNILSWFLQRWPGPCVGKNRYTGRIQHTGINAIRLLEEIGPHLLTNKNPQARLALYAYTLKAPRRAEIIRVRYAKKCIHRQMCALKNQDYVIE